MCFSTSIISSFFNFEIFLILCSLANAFKSAKFIDSNSNIKPPKIYIIILFKILWG